jgi:glycogen operon protein
MASVNFVTAHDGFTMRDLVSYNERHNEANGEDNRDGESHNRSWNHGVEGPTDDPEILALRGRQQRNMLATILLSQGVPMLLHGDELGRTQGGNNNAYCQDTPISWIDWSAVDEDLLEFTRRAVALRAAHPVLRRRRFPDGADLRWLRPDGQDMREADWDGGVARSLAVLLDGTAIGEPGPRGETIEDDDLLLLMNAHDAAIAFTLPAARGGAWRRLLDTAADADDAPAGEVVEVPGRALVVLAAGG